MRILILSDIHANLAALESVVRHAEHHGGFQAVWNLGDIVGYGPQPSECIARLREMGALSVAGNHDLAAAGEIGTADFNPAAGAAAKWTASQLSAEEKAYLAGLPQVLLPPDSGARPGEPGPGSEFTLVHGTLRDPVWEYLYSYETASGHLAMQATPYSLVGHTHVPALMVEDPDAPRGCELYRIEDGHSVPLGSHRLVINPGSVGQPRDGNRLASYGVYNVAEGTVTLHRVEYDIPATQALMEEAGLPRSLIERLAEGY